MLNCLASCFGDLDCGLLSVTNASKHFLIG